MIRRMIALFITITLLLSSFSNTAIIYADETDNDSVRFKGYEFSSYEPGTDDARLYEESGALIYRINKLSPEDWQNKVFIEKDIVFEKGKQYTIDFSLTANKDTYFSFYANPMGTWNPLISHNLSIGDYDEHFSFTTPVLDGDMEMEILFQFGGGGNQAPLKISFLDFSVKEAIGAGETENTANYKVDDFNGLFVTADGKLYTEGSGLVFETRESGRVSIDDLSFKKGCDYEIEYTIRADKEVQAAFSLDPKGGYFMQSEQSILLSGEPQKIIHRAGVQLYDRQMGITFDITKTADGELAKIVFDEIVVKEIKDGTQRNLRNAWVVDGYKLSHSETDGAVAELYADENKNITYKIEKIGGNDWNNKVAIEQGVAFLKGNAYKVSVSLEADKDLQMFFGVTSKNRWDPKIAETLQLKQGDNNFSFVTDVQKASESMDVLLQFGGGGNTAPCSIKIKSVSIEAVTSTAAQKTEEANEGFVTLVKNYSFSPSNDYRFRGFVMNDASDSELYLEQGALVYDIKTFGINQLIKNDLWLTKNTDYTVELKVSASEAMQVNYFVNEKDSQKEMAKGSSKIGKSPVVIKTEFGTGDSPADQGQLLLDLSDNTGSKKLYVHGLVVKKIENGTKRTVYMLYSDAVTDSKSDASVTLLTDGIEYNVKRFAGNPWENKIVVNYLPEFKKDKTYVVDFDMKSTKDLTFTCVLRALEKNQDDDYLDYIWDRGFIKAVNGQKHHFQYSFTPSKTIPATEMVFELGGQGNTEQTAANIFISDINITECTDFSKDIHQFTGSQGMFSYEHEQVSASAKLYQEDNCLVYKIDKQGLLNWHNKIIFNQGIKFEKGYRYKIDVTASANAKTNMRFSVVSQEDWKEKVKKYKSISTAETTLSFETSEIQKYDENAEFSLDFGGMYNTDGTTIKIKSIKIFKLKPGVPLRESSIDTYDLERIYVESDVYESTYFKGYKFNSTLLDSAYASLYAKNGILNYYIRSFGAETYSNKVFIDRMLAKANKSYKIELTARADNALDFKFGVNEIGEWNPLAIETVTLSNDYKTYTFITKAQEADTAVEIFLEFGANSSAVPNCVYISDFKISENEFQVGNVDWGNGTATSDESDGGKAMLYKQEDGVIAYEIEALGPEPWNNKIVSFDTFNNDQNYEITFTARASKPATGIFIASPASEWAPIIEQEITLGDSPSTYSFMASYMPMASYMSRAEASTEMEFQFQFGGQGNEAPVTIYFDDFSIIEKDIVDESPLTFKGNVFTHTEIGGTARGLLYTNDSGNMVYYAQKLGSAPSDNIVSTTATMTEGKDSEIKVTVKPQKGLLVTASAVDAKTGAELKSTTQWVGNNETKEMIFSVDAQPVDTDIKILVMFGQTEYASDRENNNIEFTNFSITETDPAFDEGTVTFKGNVFTHTETGETAKGILYTNDNGNMVYYAQKLGSAPSDNVVSTVASVAEGQYNEIKVTVKPQKGLDVKVSVINAETKAELKSKTQWAGDNETKEIILSVDAQPVGTDIEILVMFGQTEFADGREDNKIEFTNFSITKEEPLVDEGTITFKGNVFTHTETGETAKGILYTNDSGNMVYYAQKLGSAPSDNVVSTIASVAEGQYNEIKVTVKPQKGLDVKASVINAETKAELKSKTEWAGDNETKEIILSVDAQPIGTDIEISVMFGQEEWADAREDNKIEFTDFSITGTETIPVTLNGYTFVNEESEGAKGSLYNENGDMVYYAEKLGSADWHNKVGTSIAVENGAEYTLTVEVELDKGLDMVTTIPNAKDAGGGDAWYKNWLSESNANTLAFDITAESDSLDVFFQVGQEEWADAREDNHIVFKSISLQKKGSLVTLNGYTFVNEESEGAKGSLYNENGYMVYYAEKLGSVDWHNKVSTSIAVENGAEYTLTVEVELDKGLDMVTYIPNAKDAGGGDAWYKRWLSESNANTLTFDITAKSDSLDIFFQVGQEEWVALREDNHIVFKSISLQKKAGEPMVQGSAINDVSPEAENAEETENAEEANQTQGQEKSVTDIAEPEGKKETDDGEASNEEPGGDNEGNEDE